MNDTQFQRLKKMFDDGEVYQALRESLALRPVPEELTAMLQPPREPIPESVWKLLQPSPRTSNADHPVGKIIAAIRLALPHFQDWPVDSATGARRFQKGRQPATPPGFAEGRPGAFIRVTRALVGASENSTIYELLQSNRDQYAFQRAMKDISLSDVIDLIWMAPGALELHSVQEMLDRLATTVLRGASRKYSLYDEPRYRAALQLQLGDAPGRAAAGGVLTQYAGRAAHLRLFLETWAAPQAVEDE